MARGRRGNFMARSQRRTNWIAALTETGPETVAEQTAENFLLFDPGDVATELSKYVSPTLIRLRGQVLLDMDYAPSTLTPEHGAYWATIYVADEPLTNLNNSGFYSSDHILWTGAGGFFSNTDVQGGTETANFVTTFGHMITLEVDVKAMRKLEDNRKVFLNIASGDGDTAPVDVYYMIRGLFKE